MAGILQPSSLYQAAALCFLLCFLQPSSSLYQATAITSSTLMASSAEFSSRSCFASETAALLSFKSGITDDPANRLGSWRGHDCCRWNGVMCSNRTGHVIKLDLHNDNFVDLYHLPAGAGLPSRDIISWVRGRISNSLLSLRHLMHLDLSGNLHGGVPIPEFLGSVKSLKYLNLSYINFVGRVPPQLGNLSKLEYLDINNDYYIDINNHLDLGASMSVKASDAKRRFMM